MSFQWEKCKRHSNYISTKEKSKCDRCDHVLINLAGGFVYNYFTEGIVVGYEETSIPEYHSPVFKPVHELQSFPAYLDGWIRSLAFVASSANNKPCALGPPMEAPLGAKGYIVFFLCLLGLAVGALLAVKYSQEVWRSIRIGDHLLACMKDLGEPLEILPSKGSVPKSPNELLGNPHGNYTIYFSAQLYSDHDWEQRALVFEDGVCVGKVEGTLHD